MSFAVRLWAMTIISFVTFTLWVFIHDNLIPGLTPDASHGIVAATAWIFGVVGTVIITRFHKGAQKLERLTGYRSKPYIGSVKIVDLDETSQ
jgi:hypothetical protein